MLDLNRATLRNLPPGLRAPGFDPTAVRPGIVHLGPGNFHRAHMASYTHDLMERQPDALAWGIHAVGLQPNDRRVVETLAAQDGLYALVERGAGERPAAVVGSLAAISLAAQSTAALLEAIGAPATRIVSLTVTENGYCLDRATRQLDLNHSVIRHDLDNPRRPRSAIGVIVEALCWRRDARQPAFTALSCDNIQHNGHVLRDAVLTLAELREPALARWIAAEGAFPSSMVDRITPVTSDADVAAVEARYGVRDRWPVFCEPFRQWVIEDCFADGRPPWEEVGAQVVPDVAPYEAMKLRLLNASHLAVSAFGRLIGHVHVADCLADPDLAALMAALMDRETGPTLGPVPGVDLHAYKRALVERFANPAIRDTTARIVADAPPNMLLDPIRDRLAAAQPVDLLSLALAAWMRCMTGRDEAGAEIVSRHPLAPLLQDRASAGGPDPAPMLAIEALFGKISAQAALVDPLGVWLAMLHAQGARHTLQRARTDLGF